MERPTTAFEPDKRRSGSVIFFPWPPTSPCLCLSFTGRARPALFISTLLCFSTMDGQRRLQRTAKNKRARCRPERNVMMMRCVRTQDGSVSPCSGLARTGLSAGFRAGLYPEERERRCLSGTAFHFRHFFYLNFRNINNER
ncbi:uncharacterized [Tachysurus ichikawai]